MEPDLPELDERADRIAGFLVANGVRPGDRVGVITPKSADAVAAFIGIMKARAAYVPADHAAPAARNRTILADCAVKVAFPGVVVCAGARRMARRQRRCRRRSC